MTFFMDMGLGLKSPPPNMKIFQKMEFSLGLGHKNDIIYGYRDRVEKPPPNMKMFQDGISH